MQQTGGRTEEEEEEGGSEITWNLAATATGTGGGGKAWCRYLHFPSKKRIREVQIRAQEKDDLIKNILVD